MKEEAPTNQTQNSTKNPAPIDQVELESALDYQLQDSYIELYAALRAHTCYWKSSDTALFIMQQLCINDTEDACAAPWLSDNYNNNSSHNETFSDYFDNKNDKLIVYNHLILDDSIKNISKL